jgi:hypothetical protein
MFTIVHMARSTTPRHTGMASVSLQNYHAQMEQSAFVVPVQLAIPLSVQQPTWKQASSRVASRLWR